LEHDPEKLAPDVIRRGYRSSEKDRAPSKIWNAMAIQLKAIALYSRALVKRYWRDSSTENSPL
jgi:hypothetical protein